MSRAKLPFSRLYQIPAAAILFTNMRNSNVTPAKYITMYQWIMAGNNSTSKTANRSGWRAGSHVKLSLKITSVAFE